MGQAVIQARLYVPFVRMQSQFAAQADDENNKKGPCHDRGGDQGKPVETAVFVPGKQGDEIVFQKRGAVDQGDEGGGQEQQGKAALPDLPGAQGAGGFQGAGVQFVAVDEQAAVRILRGDDQLFAGKFDAGVDGDEFLQDFIRVHGPEIFAVEQEGNAGDAVGLFRIGRIDAQHLQVLRRLGQGKEDDVAVPQPVGAVLGGKAAVRPPEELRKDAFGGVAVIHFHGKLLPDGQAEGQRQGRQKQDEDADIDET